MRGTTPTKAELRALVKEYAQALDDYTRLSCSPFKLTDPVVRKASKRWRAAHDALVKRGREMAGKKEEPR